MPELLQQFLFLLFVEKLSSVVILHLVLLQKLLQFLLLVEKFSCLVFLYLVLLHRILKLRLKLM